MNPLAHHEYRGLRRLADLNIQNERERSKRMFGRDITNLQKKATKNTSIYEKIVPNKVQVKPRAKSLYGKKEIPPSKKDPIHQYKNEILKFMMGLQKVDPASKQKDVSEKMRQILIDWMVDVHQSFQLKQQTLHLALSYLTEYSALKEISKDEYQLVGITCLWIASKYEEIYPPRTRNYIQVTADSYSLNDLKKTEGKIIEAFEFNLNRTTSLQILEAIGEGMEEKAVNLCKYLLQYCIFAGISKNYAPATLVMSSISLCESIFKTKYDVKIQNTKVPKQTIIACFKEICSLMQSAKNADLKAIKRKYMKGKYNCVSKMTISIQ